MKAAASGWKTTLDGREYTLPRSSKEFEEFKIKEVVMTRRFIALFLTLATDFAHAPAAAAQVSGSDGGWSRLRAPAPGQSSPSA